MINEVISWLDGEIRNLLLEEKNLKLSLQSVANGQDFQSILETVTNERQ